VVQVIASSRLLRQGTLIKSGTAFERLAEADTVVFDKTGTLTEGRPELANQTEIDRGTLAQAAQLAGASKHPLARALVRAAVSAGLSLPAPREVEEVAGFGLRQPSPQGDIRLGSRAFCGLAEDDTTETAEFWFSRPGMAPQRFSFADQPRTDAADIIQRLKARGYAVELVSGDRAAAVQALAASVGIEDWRAGRSPVEKVQRLKDLAGHGRRVLMVGDGLNDAPALAAAHVSMSPSTAADVSQTAADVVFQGALLSPVQETLSVARRAAALVRQNLALAFFYNALTIPLAVAGFVTPLVAAIAMSTSSLVVIVNALRLNRGKTL